MMTNNLTDSHIEANTSAYGHSLQVLLEHQWREEMDAYEARVARLTAAHRERRARGERHPVWDFLFSYYSVTPGQLGHYSPGPAVVMELDSSATVPEQLRQPKYFMRVLVDADGYLVDSAHTPRLRSDHSRLRTGLMVDRQAFLEKRGDTADYIRRLLTSTQTRTSHFDCFGLHEWAMVYKGSQRHPDPLRLSEKATDEVVESHSIRCTHWDAYRFFTDEARPLNTCSPQPGRQMNWEQPACLHAGMDLYKWASKLGPVVDSTLWLDTFQLACDIRQLDMEASPYDLRDWGFTPVKIETPEGKREYVQRQREFAERGNILRRRLLTSLSLL